MKCLACQENQCDWLHECNYRCIEKNINGTACVCTCQVSTNETIYSAAVSIAAGIAAAYGGYVLVSKGNLQKVIVGGYVLIGAGSSLVMHPFYKKMCGEHMTVKDTTKNMLVGGVKRGITAAMRTSDKKKLWNYVATEAAFGAGIRTLQDILKLVRKTEKITLKSYIKGVGIDVLFGSVRGIISHSVSRIPRGVLV